MADPERILRRLREAGLRDTLPRRAIVETIARQRGAFTVQGVADALASEGVGRATVFRTVNALEDVGYVTRLHVGQECDRYTLCDGTHHHHLVCTVCGDVFPIEGCSIDDAARDTARRLSFTVQGHHVDVYGTCATCASAAAASLAAG